MTNNNYISVLNLYYNLIEIDCIKQGNYLYTI